MGAASDTVSSDGIAVGKLSGKAALGAASAAAAVEAASSKTVEGATSGCTVVEATFGKDTLVSFSGDLAAPGDGPIDFATVQKRNHSVNIEKCLTLWLLALSDMYIDLHCFFMKISKMITI